MVQVLSRSLLLDFLTPKPSYFCLIFFKNKYYINNNKLGRYLFKVIKRFQT
jgi:hypothetical protein